MHHEVERFKKRTVWFHWVHTAAFLLLLITGIFLFVPGWGIVAAGGVTRIIHRISAVIFVIGPVIYFIANPKMSLHFLKESLSWGSDDIGWLKAAPSYYFGGPEENMPPQGHVNSGQKLWQIIIIVSFLAFVVSGIIIWISGAVMWAVLVHDIAFIVVTIMLMVHIYLGIIHPRMSESMRSMWTGKISAGYAKSHYGKWYAEVTRGKK